MIAELSHCYEALNRRHGPRGYADYKSYRPWLRDESTFRCVYCLNRETWHFGDSDAFGADHLIPQSVDRSLAEDYDNLHYACNRCNSVRHVVDLPEPADLGAHIQFDDNGAVKPLTDIGTVFIQALGLDRPARTSRRRKIIEIIRMLEASLPASRDQLRDFMGFPDDLPDLSSLKPPAGNSRPEGITRSWFARRVARALPDYFIPANLTSQF